MKATCCVDCSSGAVFGFTPNRALYCEAHRQARSYNVMDIRCEVCQSDIDVRYGVEARRPVRCGAHRTSRDLVVWPAPTCDECDQYLIYGRELGAPMLCHGAHQSRPPGYWNVSRAPCIAPTAPTGGVCRDRPVWTRVPQGNGEPELCSKHKFAWKKRDPTQQFAKVFTNETKKARAQTAARHHSTGGAHVAESKKRKRASK